MLDDNLAFLFSYIWGNVWHHKNTKHKNWIKAESEINVWRHDDYKPLFSLFVTKLKRQSCSSSNACLDLTSKTGQNLKKFVPHFDLAESVNVTVPGVSDC